MGGLSQIRIQLRACGDQSLAGFVGLVLDEVLDEAAGQILGLLLPDSGIGVGVPGIQDGGVHAGQLGGHFKEIGRASCRERVFKRV